MVLRAGIIEQTGTPLELYNNPCNKFVAGFIGSPAMNFIAGKAKNGTLTLPILGDKTYKVGAKIDGNVTVGIRPEHITIDNKSGGI